MKKTVYITPNDDLQKVFNEIADGDRITFSTDIYRIEKPIEVNYKNKIVIDGSNAVLCGTKIIDGEIKPYKDGIFVIETEKGLDIQEIFVDNVKYIMARYPKYDENQRLCGCSSDVIEHISHIANPKGGYIRALHSYEWGGNDYIIDGRDGNGKLIFKWVGDNNRGSDYHKDFLMAENLFEDLTDEKEWFYDRENGLLYIKPESGKELKNIEATVNGEIFKFNGCSDIQIRDVRFEKTKRMLFCSKYEKITRSDWGIAKNGAVLLYRTNGLSMTNCKFDSIGGNCVFIKDKNRNISIDNCEFTNCGASGVCVFGNQECVRDLSTWENHKTEIADKTVGPIGDDFPTDINIENCYFTKLGIYEKQSAPVSISVSSRVSVKGCTIHDMPRAGLNVCDGSFGGHLFENNLVFDTVLETGDHGPFNSWGRDRYWSLGGFDTGGGNGYAKKEFATLDAIETTVIRHNMFVGSRGFGIDLDDGSTNYLIENNFCVGVGIKLREGFFRTVRNNLIISAPLDIHCAFDSCDDLLEHNIVVNSQPTRPICCEREGKTTAVKNNLFVGADENSLHNDVLGKYENFTSDISDKAALRGITDKIPFVPFNFDFGRKDKPKPTIPEFKSDNDAKVEKLNAIFNIVDDSVRSMAGLPDYCGAFVEEISENSPLFSLGVIRHDVILEINGKKIKSPETLPNIIEGKTIISRGQKIIEL